MAKPNANAPLGQGGRFAAVEASARASGARDPAAVAAAVGRKKYGKKKFAALGAKGRKAKSKSKSKSSMTTAYQGGNNFRGY